MVALFQRLAVRQTQALIMTPQLQQAIKLLQFSHIELNEFVESELEQNPLLERDGEQIPEAPREDAPAADPEPELNSSGGDEEELTVQAVDGEGDGSLDFGGDPLAWSASRPSTAATEELPGLDQTLSRPLTLHEHLVAQLAMGLADPIDRIIGHNLIAMVDEAGYLPDDFSSLAERLGCPAVRVDATLAKLQGFDPPGIFARNLSECLALQLRDRDRLDAAMRIMLDHLPLVASRDAAALMRLCGVDAKRLAGMVAEIRALNPKPGLAFDGAIASPIVPDVLVRAQPNGDWIIELNSDALPRVLVNDRYFTTVSRATRDKAERDYIVERHQQAGWLVKALHQRATTILKVAREIVRQQDGFFRHGVQHLKPLVLRDIATEIGMHESTVSRVTSNKYLQSPRGLFELKYFFTASVASASGGDALSAEAVRFRIKSLVDGERDEILSDDRLVELLHDQGIAIARRTVAKYRELLHIASSVQRRRAKTLSF
jgi:RNA polymerase sigma-54 factor